MSDKAVVGIIDFWGIVIVVAIAALSLFVAGLYHAERTRLRRIDRQQHMILRELRARRCTHGASSIAGVMRHGRFVVTLPPTRTGCQ